MGLLFCLTFILRLVVFAGPDNLPVVAALWRERNSFYTHSKLKLTHTQTERERERDDRLLWKWDLSLVFPAESVAPLLPPIPLIHSLTSLSHSPLCLTGNFLLLINHPSLIRILISSSLFRSFPFPHIFVTTTWWYSDLGFRFLSFWVEFWL